MQTDPWGKAIDSFFNGNKNAEVNIHSNEVEMDPLPVSYLYRAYKEMPEIERLALNMAEGEILDIGAAAGTHAIALQDLNKNVTALELSKIACSVIKKRGVKNVVASNFYDFKGKFDTLLFLMNGAGIMGTIENAHMFFKQCKNLLNPQGQILVDSSNLIFLFDEDEIKNKTINGHYYGQVNFQNEFEDEIDEPYPWIYFDSDLLEELARKNGFRFELINEGEHFEYLAKLTLV